jgi:hypothetical protein
MNSTNPKIGTVLKIGMYILSLWLLFLLIIVNKIDVPVCFRCEFIESNKLWDIVKNNTLPIASVTFLLISFLFYVWFKYLLAGTTVGPHRLVNLESKGSEHLVFLATYVIPLVGFSLENARQIINLGITLAIIGVIYVKTNLFYANPTLSLLGFRVYESDFGSGRVIFISTDDLDEGDDVNYIVLDRKTFFAKKSLRIP